MMRAIVDIHGKLERTKLDGEFGDAHNGAAFIKLRSGAMARVIFSNGDGWEHVSMSLKTRTPTWEEMCELKELFWTDDDVVVQYHPRRVDYVNLHPHCLHLWAPTPGDPPLPQPPSWMVGP